jgi:hypothetical protein
VNARSARQLVRTTTAALSLLTYAVGLVSPLTPSEGHPSILEVLIFAGLPLTALIALAITSTVPAGRIVFVIFAIGILAFTAHLLSIQLRV